MRVYMSNPGFPDLAVDATRFVFYKGDGVVCNFTRRSETKFGTDVSCPFCKSKEVVNGKDAAMVALKATYYIRTARGSQDRGGWMCEALAMALDKEAFANSVCWVPMAVKWDNCDKVRQGDYAVMESADEWAEGGDTDQRRTCTSCGKLGAPYQMASHNDRTVANPSKARPYINHSCGRCLWHNPLYQEFLDVFEASGNDISYVRRICGDVYGRTVKEVLECKDELKKDPYRIDGLQNMDRVHKEAADQLLRSIAMAERKPIEEIRQRFLNKVPATKVVAREETPVSEEVLAWRENLHRNHRENLFKAVAQLSRRGLNNVG